MNDNEKNKMVSEVFHKHWGNVNEEEISKEFMEAIDSILAWSRSEDGDEDNTRNIYDAPFFYQAIAKAIEKFSDLYHVVSITKGWKNNNNVPY